MSTDRDRYLAKLRADTAYPELRGIIDLVANLMVVLAVVLAIVTLFTTWSMLPEGLLFLVLGFAKALLVFYGARVFKWLAFMLVDVVDGVHARNARELDD